MAEEPWLASHLDALSRTGRRVLELGCGPGRDAALLRNAGFNVVAADLAPHALARARKRIGVSALLRIDHGHPLPVQDASFHAVVASLSLHYLPWNATLATVQEVRRVLVPGGVFLFRVNATDDVAHGAAAGVEVEHHFRWYAPGDRYGDQFKRFFDEDDVRRALDATFEVEHLVHITIQRGGLPKRVWECRARAGHLAQGT